jgi:hypothetical protein
MEQYIKDILLKQDITWIHRITTGSAGDTVEDAPVNFKGHRTGSSVMEITAAGIRIYSAETLYLDGPDFQRLSKNDVITFPRDSIKYIVHKLEPVYKGGELELGVVYLR